MNHNPCSTLVKIQIQRLLWVRNNAACFEKLTITTWMPWRFVHFLLISVIYNNSVNMRKFVIVIIMSSIVRAVFKIVFFQTQQPRQNSKNQKKWKVQEGLLNTILLTFKFEVVVGACVGVIRAFPDFLSSRKCLPWYVHKRQVT